MPFRAELRYEQQDVMKAEKAFRKIQLKNRYPLSRVRLVLIRALEIVLIALFLNGLGLMVETTAILFLVAVLGLGGLWVALPALRHRERCAALNSHGPESFTAEEEQMHFRAAGIETSIRYELLTLIARDGEYVYLYIDRWHFFFIPQRCVAEGDPATFLAFLSEKTGLKVTEIK